MVTILHAGRVETTDVLESKETMSSRGVLTRQQRRRMEEFEQLQTTRSRRTSNRTRSRLSNRPASAPKPKPKPRNKTKRSKSQELISQGEEKFDKLYRLLQVNQKPKSEDELSIVVQGL